MIFRSVYMVCSISFREGPAFQYAAFGFEHRNEDIIHERIVDFNAYFCQFYERGRIFPVFSHNNWIFIVISYSFTCLSTKNICFYIVVFSQKITKKPADFQIGRLFLHLIQILSTLLPKSPESSTPADRGTYLQGSAGAAHPGSPAPAPPAYPGHRLPYAAPHPDW